MYMGLSVVFRYGPNAYAFPYLNEETVSYDTYLFTLGYAGVQIAWTIIQIIIFRYALQRWLGVDYFQTSYYCMTDLGWIFYAMVASIPIFVPILVLQHGGFV